MSWSCADSLVASAIYQLGWEEKMHSSQCLVWDDKCFLSKIGHRASPSCKKKEWNHHQANFIPFLSHISYHFARHWLAVWNQIHGKSGKKLHFLHIWSIQVNCILSRMTGVQSKAVNRFLQVAIFEVVRLHF